jgi:arginine:pyruvate transaminase
MRKEYRARRDFVLRKLSKVSQLSCSRPRAGMFIMSDVSGTGMSGREFAEQLLSAEQVSVVPGDAFGPSAAGFVRIGLAQNQVTLRKACKRIRRFCEGL